MRPHHLRLPGVTVLGGLAAAVVGCLAAVNSRASPAGEWAVIVLLATVMVLVGAGVNAQTGERQERMGWLLVAAGFCASLWLLQGSSDPLAFSIGWLCSGLVLPLFCYLMLAYPTGRLHSQVERRFMLGTSILVAVCWTFVVFTSAQPPVSTPLVRCAPHCPSNILFLGVSTNAAPVLLGVLGATWLTLAVGVVAFLFRRLQTASGPVHRSIAPVLLSSMAYALSVAGLLLAAGALPSKVVSLSWVSIAVAPAIPLAMLLGLTRERLFMGRALAGLVNGFAGATCADLQTLMADALRDPSLRIVYRRPQVGTYVDSSGAPVALPARDPQLAFTTIEREGSPVAVVIYDAELLDQRRFIEAAGAAGLIWLQNAQLAADLKASMVDLAASRRRLVETADIERQRIERDLHDGAQQHLVGMRLRLELAAEAISDDPRRGEQMLAEIGKQMDEALEELRCLAQGVYPPLLPEHGLGEAIRSASRRSPFPGSVEVHGIGRYPADTETAVYFCCLEALQNIAKHAGPQARGTVRLWEEEARLCFEVSDEGPGFSPEAVEPGNGLVNMRDRMEAAGGALTVTSREGRGTSVWGSVPIATALAARKRMSPTSVDAMPWRGNSVDDNGSNQRARISAGAINPARERSFT